MIPFNEFDWKVSHENFMKNKGVRQKNISFKIQQSTGRKCVVKRTSDCLSNSYVEKSFNKEISLLVSQHQAIVPFIGFYVKNNYGHIVLEEMENGSLDSLLIKHRKGFRDPLLDDTHKLIIAYGISNAMKYLHEQQIVFRNLHPSHVLLDSKLHPYLTSFGRSLRADIPVPTSFEERMHFPAYENRRFWSCSN